MRTPPKMPQMPPMGVPMLGQQQQPSQEEQARQQIMATIHQTSLGMYVDLATRYLATRDDHETIDLEYLRELAKSAKLAAEAYFQGLGIIDTNRGTDGHAH